MWALNWAGWTMVPAAPDEFHNYFSRKSVEISDLGIRRKYVEAEAFLCAAMSDLTPELGS